MKCSSFNCELVSKLSNFLRPFPENETREAAVEFLQLNYSLIKFGAEKTFVLPKELFGRGFGGLIH